MIILPNWDAWVDGFFNELEMYEDIHNSCTYKQDLLGSIKGFLTCGDEVHAERVYFSFFDAYWLGDRSDNPFLELVKSVSAYEQTAGSLIRNQRDHYCHAVYVFIIGIIIYYNCKNVQDVFDRYVKGNGYLDYYTTKHEEFLYRWGVASLFHDVAYPLEITIKQLNEYYNYSVSYGEEMRRNRYLNIGGLDLYKAIHSFSIPEEYKGEFSSKYGNTINLDKMDSCTLLAMDISRDLGVDKQKLCHILSGYDQKISEGIIDHAYFGALICLKWHSSLISASVWNPAYFYFPVMDASAAIFLHNAYEHCIMEDFGRGLLRLKEKPIAFLLCLADTLQEWNRKAYGRETAANVFLGANFDFHGENGLSIEYSVSDLNKIRDLSVDINKKLDVSSLPCLQISYKQIGEG